MTLPAAFDFATALADHGNYDLLRTRYPEPERVFDVIDAVHDDLDQMQEDLDEVAKERDEIKEDLDAARGELVRIQNGLDAVVDVIDAVHDDLLRTVENPSDDIKDFLDEHADR